MEKIFVGKAKFREAQAQFDPILKLDDWEIMDKVDQRTRDIVTGYIRYIKTACDDIIFMSIVDNVLLNIYDYFMFGYGEYEYEFGKGSGYDDDDGEYDIEYDEEKDDELDLDDELYLDDDPNLMNQLQLQRQSQGFAAQTITIKQLQNLEVGINDIFQMFL